MNKTNARETAMKMLFAHSLGGDYSINQNDENDIEAALSAKDSAFCRKLVEGVFEYESELREAISEFSQGWSIERIGKVELCILQIAAFEILHLPEIPVGASVNEAVELTKSYCDEKSAAFVNGILGSIGRKYRS